MLAYRKKIEVTRSLLLEYKSVSHLLLESLEIQSIVLYVTYIGLCKLENEILKEAKNAENHIFRPKNYQFLAFF